MTRYAPQWLQSGSYAASLDRRLIGALWPAPACSGVAVTAVGTGMDLHVDPGQVAVPSPNNTGSVLCTSDAIETVTLAPAPPANTDRVDLVVCHPRSVDLDGSSSQEDFIFEVVAGAEGAPPGVAPAVPAGTVALAQVHVVGGSATIAAGNITDRRPPGLAIPTPATIAKYGMRASAGAVTSPATASTAQKVPLVKVYDQANALANSTYTCPVAGRYLVRGSVSASVNNGVNVNCRLYRNGAADTIYGAANAYPSSAATGVQAVALIMCAAGDTLELWWQTTAASIPMRAVASEAYLAIDYLGPT